MRLLSIYLALVLALIVAFTPSSSHAAPDPQIQPSEVGIVGDVATQAGDEVTSHKDTHEEKGGLPQLNIATYPSQIFWLLVMFAVLYTTFSKNILPTIGNVVNARDNMIKANLDEAHSLKEKAIATQSFYEKSLEMARANASKAVLDVENAAKKRASDQIDMFRKKAEGEITVAETRIEAAKNNAIGGMTQVAAEVAGYAAEKITGIGTDPQDAHAIVEGLTCKAKAA